MNNNGNIPFDSQAGTNGVPPIVNKAPKKYPHEYFSEKVRNADKVRDLVNYYNAYVKVYNKTKIALFVSLGIAFISFFIFQFVGAVVVFLLCGAVVLVLRVNAEAKISPKVEKIMPYREFVPVCRQIMKDK